MASNFRAIPQAYDLTQYLRGKLFVYVDFLMGAPNTYTEEDIDLVIEFLKSAIRCVVAWLKAAPALL